MKDDNYATPHEFIRSINSELTAWGGDMHYFKDEVTPEMVAALTRRVSSWLDTHPEGVEGVAVASGWNMAPLPPMPEEFYGPDAYSLEPPEAR